MPPIKQTLSAYTELIESRLNTLIPRQSGLCSPLFEASRYALLGGGKRIRPVLTLAVAELFGSNITHALDTACAIEMIHTYSMIHDDLPCMDDDDYRRGKLSVHKQYNEAIAVLSGDFLLTNAFDVVANANHLAPDTRLQIIQSISQASGGQGMIGGQIMDILSEDTPISIEILQELHGKKTGDLIACAVKCGCLIANAPSDHQQLIEKFAGKIGLAFQVIDDLLDVAGGKNKRGSQHSSDISNSKSTYISLLGVEAAKETADSLVKSALEYLEELPYHTKFLEDLSHFILKRNY